MPLWSTHIVLLTICFYCKFNENSFYFNGKHNHRTQKLICLPIRQAHTKQADAPSFYRSATGDAHGRTNSKKRSRRQRRAKNRGEVARNREDQDKKGKGKGKGKEKQKPPERWPFHWITTPGQPRNTHSGHYEKPASMGSPGKT